MNYPNPHGQSCPWFPQAESWGGPNVKWCEETLCHWISEPALTWSNLSYILVAIVITYLSFKNKDDIKLKQFGPIIFFMGAMSFFYHLSNFYGSQVLDFVGMFFFVGWAKGINLIRLEKMDEKYLIPFNFTVVIVYTLILHYMYLQDIKFQSLVLLSALIIIFTEFLAFKKQKNPVKWFIVGMFFLAIAFVFSALDHSRVWCNPTDHGWFSQGHALWHWIAGVAMFFIYKHYSHETVLVKNP